MLEHRNCYENCIIAVKRPATKKGCHIYNPAGPLIPANQQGAEKVSKKCFWAQFFCGCKSLQKVSNKSFLALGISVCCCFFVFATWVASWARLGRHWKFIHMVTGPAQPNNSADGTTAGRCSQGPFLRCLGHRPEAPAPSPRT